MSNLPIILFLYFTQCRPQELDYKKLFFDERSIIVSGTVVQDSCYLFVTLNLKLVISCGKRRFFTKNTKYERFICLHLEAIMNQCIEA